MDQELATSLGQEVQTSEQQVEQGLRDAILDFCREEFRLFEMVDGPEPRIAMCCEWTPWWEVRDRATADQDKLAATLHRIVSRHSAAPIHSDDLESVHEVYVALGGQRLGHVIPQDVEWRDLRISSVFGEPDCVDYRAGQPGRRWRGRDFRAKICTFFFFVQNLKWFLFFFVAFAAVGVGMRI